MFLIATGIKMIVFADKEYDVAKNPLLAFMRRRFNVTDEHHGEKFFVKKADPKTGKLAWFMTPLFLALVLIEVADVIFAVDSVPAIFAITTDPFIVYTSNIFAILGLRALYFALAAMVKRFHYLKLALAIVLIFIGSKIFAAALLGLDKIPPAISLSRHLRHPGRWAWSTACGRRGGCRRKSWADGASRSGSGAPCLAWRPDPFAACLGASTPLFPRQFNSNGMDQKHARLLRPGCRR